jgi:hypothetical protein
VRTLAENDRGSTASTSRWRTGQGGTGSAAKAEQAIIIELLERGTS